MQQVHVQGPAPGSGNPKHKHRLGREWIKNSPEEKDLCACCPESQPYPRLHQKKCRSKKVIVSLYCALEYRPQPWNPQQIKDMDLMKWKKPKKNKIINLISCLVFLSSHTVNHINARVFPSEFDHCITMTTVYLL